MRSFVVALSLLICACGHGGAPKARAAIRNKLGPKVQQIVLDIMLRHDIGIRHAADRIAAGFVKVSGDQQEEEMRKVLKLVRSPKHGVPELVISPMSFIAVVGKDGKCIARDMEPDPMKGMELANQFPVVADALQGKTGTAIGEFKSEDSAKPSVTILMAAPAHYKGEVVGALVLGIPLWRLQQVLTKQMQMELAGKEGVDLVGKKDSVFWVYVYRGAELYMHGTPPDLDKLVPDAKARAAGLAKSPGGYTGEVEQFSFWYGYGVRPLRVLGPDIGVVMFLMEPD